MTLEIQRKHYRAGGATQIDRVTWEVSTHSIEGDLAIPLSPQEIAELVDCGSMLYVEPDRSYVRLKVLDVLPS